MADEERLNTKDKPEKSKKKIKAVSFADDLDAAEKSAEAPPVAEEVVADDDNIEGMFADMKKKKKKKKKSQEEVENLADEVKELDVQENRSGSAASGEHLKEDHDDDIVYKATADTDEPVPEGETLEDLERSWKDSDRDYTYKELLSRVFRIIRIKNPELSGEKRRYTMIPPSVAREGSKKTVFANIIEICNRMYRSPEHLTAYIFAELGTQGSMDGSQRLVIKGRFQQKQIENVLRHYILEYVTCKTCRSPETNLRKENRLFFLQCEACGSSRAVTAIKSGFMAQTAKRKTARQ